MNELNIDDLMSKAKNKFLLANAAAGRAKQIVEGSLPYVNHFDPNNPVITALREIAADKVRIKVLSGPSKKPQEILAVEEEAPSALERLAKDKKSKSTKKEKKK
ncbi:MAG: DNA-directed RNA polymerase subunit omega [Candidatus Saganbacteria bacterium]|nr:DNA-directed RNA polymerase subunit omega [Candidatus Saganbacteria bacterium]